MVTLPTPGMVTVAPETGFPFVSLTTPETATGTMSRTAKSTTASVLERFAGFEAAPSMIWPSGGCAVTV